MVVVCLLRARPAVSTALFAKRDNKSSKPPTPMDQEAASRIQSAQARTNKGQGDYDEPVAEFSIGWLVCFDCDLLTLDPCVFGVLSDKG